MTYSKQLKLPAFSNNTKLLCFDLESNGLHGEVFAIGAVIMDASGEVFDEFTGRCKIVGQPDAWVEKNVLPAIKNMPMTHTSYKALREAFWKWYVGTEQNADYVLVSNGYPVEYRFLLKCQDENLKERYWQHPFPLLDLTSLLLLASSNATKSQQMAELAKTSSLTRHHPFDDAKMSVLLALAAIKKIL